MNWKVKQNKLLEKLIQNVGDTQMTFFEYKFISDLVHEKDGINFLIFGLGYDSELWLESNNNGNTVFLESDPVWIENTKKEIPDIDVRLIEYNSKPTEYLEYWEIYKKTGQFPNIPTIYEDLNTIDWDVIFIDGPVGRINGRMISIYLSDELAKKSKNKTHIFLHDCERNIESFYLEKFLKENCDYFQLYNSDDNNFKKLSYFIK
jgi:uncharacterized protein (TIGR01627 family)